MKKHILINTGERPSVTFYDEGSTVANFVHPQEKPFTFPTASFTIMTKALGMLKLKNSRIVLEAPVGISNHNIDMLKSVSSDFVVLDGINEGLKNFAIGFFNQHVKSGHAAIADGQPMYIIVSNSRGGLSIYKTRMDGMDVDLNATLIKTARSFGAMFEAAPPISPFENDLIREDVPDLARIDQLIAEEARRILASISGTIPFNEEPPTYTEELLAWKARFKSLTKDSDTWTWIDVIRYYTRGICDQVLATLISEYKMHNVIFVGDLFNEALNTTGIVQKVKGLMCVVANAQPSAGEIVRAGFKIFQYSTMSSDNTLRLDEQAAYVILDSKIYRRIVGSAYYGYVAVPPSTNNSVHKYANSLITTPISPVIIPIVCEKNQL